MSIERTMGGFTGFDMECNGCGQVEYFDFDWDNFNAMIAEAKAGGWKIFKDEYGEWMHFCSECSLKEMLKKERGERDE